MLLYPEEFVSPEGLVFNSKLFLSLFHQRRYNELKATQFYIPQIMETICRSYPNPLVVCRYLILNLKKELKNDQIFLSAISRGHYPLVKYLFHEGYFQNNLEDYLLYAIEHTPNTISNWRIKIIKFFLRKGANPTAKNNLALKLASFQGDSELVRILLVYGADCSADKHQPLLIAVKGGHLSVIKVILTQHPQFDSNRELILSYACQNRELWDYFLSERFL